MLQVIFSASSWPCRTKGSAAHTIAPMLDAARGDLLDPRSPGIARENGALCK